jgi:general L-amino acid transport system substrate-binding protein
MNMNRKYTLMLLVAMLLSLLLVACGGETEVEVTRVVEVEVTRVVEVSGEAAPAEPVTFAGGGDTLAQVQSRGVLKCGGNQNVPGFGYLDPDSGDFSGFDIDFCWF